MKKFLPLLLIPAFLAGCGGGEQDYSNFILGLGASGVPVGVYSSQILTHFGINEAKLNENGHISYGDNVGVVANQIKQGLVSAGMIYKTDAFSYELTVVDFATADMLESQVIYPMAVLAQSTKKDAAKSFLSYLRTQAAMDRFEAVGFTGMNKLDEALPQVESATTLKVFAATSMTASLNNVISDYRAVASNITIDVNYGGSNALKQQIENGAECDIFISADQAKMDGLQSGGFIDTSTRVNFLENQVVLSVPSHNPYQVDSYAKLVSILDQLDN